MKIRHAAIAACALTVAFVGGLCLAADEPAGRQPLSDSQIQRQIAVGKHYGNTRKLWSKEFRKTNEFTLGAGYFWVASLRVLTDAAMIEMSAATAAHELRDFSLSDARSLPDLGKLRVMLVASDSGSRQKLISDIHVVMEVDGHIAQPLDQSGTETSNSAYPWFQSWGTKAGLKRVYTFSWPPSIENCRFIVISVDDKKRGVTVDFSKLH